MIYFDKILSSNRLWGVSTGDLMEITQLILHWMQKGWMIQERHPVKAKSQRIGYHTLTDRHLLKN